MRSVTTIFFLAAGVSLWLEQTLTNDAASAGEVLVVAQAEDVTTDTATTEIEELSAEEIEAELKRAQELLNDPDAPKEFLQSKPLPADIAIDLPSDI